MKRVSAARIVMAAAALAAGSPAIGVPAPKPPAFAMCGTCHVVAKGQRSMVGPNLWGVAGRKAGTLPGYSYSPAMKKSSIVWTRDRLLAFVAAPRAVVPGNKMAFAGQRNPKTAAAITDYLMSLK